MRCIGNTLQLVSIMEETLTERFGQLDVPFGQEAPHFGELHWTRLIDRVAELPLKYRERMVIARWRVRRQLNRESGGCPLEFWTSTFSPSPVKRARPDPALPEPAVGMHSTRFSRACCRCLRSRRPRAVHDRTKRSRRKNPRD